MAERETSEAQRKRQDAEKSEVREARRVRLGHIEKPKKANAKKNDKKEAEVEE